MTQIKRQRKANARTDLAEALRHEVVGQQHVLLDGPVGVADGVLVEGLRVAVRVEAEAQLAAVERQRAPLGEPPPPPLHGHRLQQLHVRLHRPAADARRGGGPARGLPRQRGRHLVLAGQVVCTRGVGWIGIGRDCERGALVYTHLGDRTYTYMHIHAPASTRRWAVA